MNIEFREPRNIRELELLFQLRFSVYAEDVLLNTMLSNTNEIDINNFDINALHFGAFENDLPLACIRIVTNKRTKFSLHVEELISKHKIECPKIQETFPLEIYYSDKTWTADLLMKLSYSKIGEVGKLAIDKKYRKKGIVLDGMIQSIIEYGTKEHAFDFCFGICNETLFRYYKKFGFLQAEGSLKFAYKGLPEAFVVCYDAKLMRR
jgi:hypothetical protein